jgi:hypothetical protein
VDFRISFCFRRKGTRTIKIVVYDPNDPGENSGMGQGKKALETIVGANNP